MKPILFNTEMVKAILDGRKTQTRIPIKLNCKKDNKTHSLNGAVFTIDNKLYFEHNLIENFSKYKTGDVCYVREAFYPLYNDEDSCLYKADYPLHWTAVDAVYGDIETDTETEKRTVWKPSIHMPKKYARIFLKVTNVKVERLQDMKNTDYLLEGVNKSLLYKDLAKKYPPYIGKYSVDKIRFIDTWNSTAIDGYKWEDNPNVFVYEFERVEI